MKSRFSTLILLGTVAAAGAIALLAPGCASTGGLAVHIDKAALAEAGALGLVQEASFLITDNNPDLKQDILEIAEILDAETYVAPPDMLGMVQLKIGQMPIGDADARQIQMRLSHITNLLRAIMVFSDDPVAQAETLAFYQRLARAVRTGANFAAPDPRESPPGVTQLYYLPASVPPPGSPELARF